MSISAEYAQEHRNDAAVLCCRTEAGTTLSEHNLEDPAIFDDLMESGLLKLEGALTIGQVLGATLTETADSLTPITERLVAAVAPEEGASSGEASLNEEAGPAAAVPSTAYRGVLRIHIDEGKGIDLELPMGIGGADGAAAPVQAPVAAPAVPAAEEASAPEEKSYVRRELKNYAFPVKDVRIGAETSFENGILTVRESLLQEALEVNPLVTAVTMDIIRPEKQDVYVNTMMDVQPIAVKKEGELGTGVTFELTGVQMLLTGTDEVGLQTAEANVSNGIYEKNVYWGRPGAPDKDAFIIHVNVTIKEGTGMERPGPLASHQAMDVITQEIREVLRKKEIADAAEERTYTEMERPGKPRVLLVKEIMGQGAMHDNLILPDEPCGFFGGRPNVDLGNVPVFLRVNEVRDGGIHALTCITPDTKEASLLYWREPNIKLLAEDEEINFVGVLFVGSPQANTEKFYVSRRVGATVEAMKVDGCIVTTEGFGNNHIDFASHIEQIGSLGIPVVGVSYCGVQGALVVGNKYMDAMVDLCVSEDGNVEDILAKNSLSPEAAFRAVAMLKTKMGGEKINSAPKHFNPDVIEENANLAKEVYRC
ncbi:MAG: D-proline reductase (dithiol) proprotein PrdA [Oscillospiraceae bacterium]